ncbi:MAG: FAD-binding protein [Planctomycetes bacterium]|nr:FAD-binding protein [Planctomycetota bacterium]
MLDNSVLNILKSVIPSDRISTAPEDLTAASYDASKRMAQPDVVIKPIKPEEISAVLKIANENNIPVYPRGAATSVTGSAVPVKGGIVIDTSKMNHIIEINKTNLMAIVEPGVVVGDFQKAVEKEGLFYPPDPASADTCTIGGNIATSAGGLRCIKYGVTRDYVIGLEAVLADGTIIHTGSYTIKCSTGYDLTRLFVGSEGTLGIFTKIILKLIPKPEHRETIIAFYRKVDTAVSEAQKILDNGILPTALEFMDERSTKAVQSYYKEFSMPEGTKAIILLELDGAKSDTLRLADETIKIWENGDAIKILHAKNRIEADNLWAVRKAISPALFSITEQKISEDISLPLNKIIPMMETLAGLEAKYGIPIAVFGHLGDGNLHVNLLTSVGGQEKPAEEAVEEIFKATVALGGTLSGEHGIGITKSKYISLAIPPREFEIMKQLKNLFDPKGILNPGKLF